MIKSIKCLAEIHEYAYDMFMISQGILYSIE